MEPSLAIAYEIYAKFGNLESPPRPFKDLLRDYWHLAKADDQVINVAWDLFKKTQGKTRITAGMVKKRILELIRIEQGKAVDAPTEDAPLPAQDREMFITRPNPMPYIEDSKFEVVLSFEFRYLRDKGGVEGKGDIDIRYQPNKSFLIPELVRLFLRDFRAKQVSPEMFVPWLCHALYNSCRPRCMKVAGSFVGEATPEEMRVSYEIPAPIEKIVGVAPVEAWKVAENPTPEPPYPYQSEGAVEKAQPDVQKGG
jgi:hypothetical protein